MFRLESSKYFLPLRSTDISVLLCLLCLACLFPTHPPLAFQWQPLGVTTLSFLLFLIENFLFFFSFQKSTEFFLVFLWKSVRRFSLINLNEWIFVFYSGFHFHSFPLYPFFLLRGRFFSKDVRAGIYPSCTPCGQNLGHVVSRFFFMRHIALLCYLSTKINQQNTSNALEEERSTFTSRREVTSNVTSWKTSWERGF